MTGHVGGARSLRLVRSFPPSRPESPAVSSRCRISFSFRRHFASSPTVDTRPVERIARPVARLRNYPSRFIINVVFMGRCLNYGIVTRVIVPAVTSSPGSPCGTSAIIRNMSAILCNISNVSYTVPYPFLYITLRHKLRIFLLIMFDILIIYLLF